MGIHSGPVSDVRDVNEQSNIAGAGINIAQRVMERGDAGHFLFRRVSDDLEQYRNCVRIYTTSRMRNQTRQKISIVNLYNREVRDPEVPINFRQPKDAQC